MILSKDQSILDLLSRADLRAKGWVTVDYWEADLCAIGIRSIRDTGRLVYVSTFRKPRGLFDYECEGSGGVGEPYIVTKSGQDVTFEELLKVLITHLT